MTTRAVRVCRVCSQPKLWDDFADDWVHQNGRFACADRDFDRAMNRSLALYLGGMFLFLIAMLLFNIAGESHGAGGTWALGLLAFPCVVAGIGLVAGAMR